MFRSSRESERGAVLLIDDDPVVREVIATVLTMNGYAVHTAADGGAALELLNTGGCAPAVILVDAQMPGLSGKELFVHLRQCSSARIFLVSGSHPSEELVGSADGFLLKPFHTSDLEKLLNRTGAHSAVAAHGAATNGSAVLPIISARTLSAFRGMMPETSVRQVYAALATDLEQRTAALEAAIARGDDAEVRRIGHSIKGGCAVAGAQRAARLGELIEAGALDHQGNQLDNRANLLKELNAAAQDLQRMLEAEFPSLP